MQLKTGAETHRESRMKISSPLKLVLILLTALCAGCGGAQPREGLLLFHDPGQKVRSGKVLPPQTFIFTSDRAAGASSLQVSAGIRGKSNKTSPQGGIESNAAWRQRTLRQFKISEAIQPNKLTAELFGHMIDQLDKAGLFLLPSLPGSNPPRNRAFVLVTYKDGTSTVYPKPDKTTIDRKFPPEQARTLYRAWYNTKVVMVQFVSAN